MQKLQGFWSNAGLPSTVILVICSFIYSHDLSSLLLLALGVSAAALWIFLKLKVVERDFRQGQESLNFALQSGKMGTWEIDLKNNSLNCSAEMLELWNVTTSEFFDQRSILQEKVHPQDLDHMKSSIGFAIKNESVYELEYRILPRPGEERWVMSRGRCMYDQNQKAVKFAGVVYDITDRKLKEEALAEAIRIRENFMTIASHELKTPLTCMQLQIQVRQWDLKNRFPESFTQDRIGWGLQKQSEHVERITRIIDNILDVSKIAEGRFTIQHEHFDLAEMVRDVLDRFRITSESSNIQINFLPAGKVTGYWDRFRIEQVLLNLLMNGIRYGNKQPLEIEVSKDEEHALLIVRDKGIGIKAEDISRVFERFERAHSDSITGGMGLGLYISNNIIRAHGGEIKLKSEPGIGSEFSVHLPFVPKTDKFENSISS